MRAVRRVASGEPPRRALIWHVAARLARIDPVQDRLRYPEPLLQLQPGVLLARGVSRALVQRGWATLTEVTLANGRRADVMAIEGDGGIVIVEVKSSIVDFRSDQKWGEYREFCDALYFAVPEDFPVELIPDSCGLIAADHFGAEIVRPAPRTPLNAARRKAVTLRFVQLAAQRLHRLLDPAAAL
jgi:hypothetical protein